jgi:hypothetical protein
MTSDEIAAVSAMEILIVVRGGIDFWWDGAVVDKITRPPCCRAPVRAWWCGVCVCVCSRQELQLGTVRTHNWHILPCSAMTGMNLKEGLAWVVEDAKKRLFLY